MSRPRKTAASRMSCKITFRLTQAEYNKLDAEAQRIGLSANQFARKLACSRAGKLITKTYKRFDPAYIAQLKRLGNLLNQLVKNAHIFKRVSPKVSQLCLQIEKIIFEAIDEEVDE